MKEFFCEDSITCFCLGKPTGHFSIEFFFCHFGYNSFVAFSERGCGGKTALWLQREVSPRLFSYSKFRWILPLMVLGRSSRKTTMRGYL